MHLEPFAERLSRFPFIACEILASEVWTIVDAVYKNEDLVAQLFAFLEKDAPLNALMASFVSRVTAVLLEKKPSQMVELLKKKDNFISLFLKHLSSASVMELLLKVVAAEELCEGGGILQWLRDSHLIKSLVSKLDASLDSETHENASKALVEIIRASTTKSSPLMDELEGEDTLRHLLDTVFADVRHDNQRIALRTHVCLAERELHTFERPYRYYRAFEAQCQAYVRSRYPREPTAPCLPGLRHQP
jgi:hypothetical protein